MRSIRKELLTGLIAGILVTTVVIGAVSLWGVRDEIHEIMDYEMEQTALFMLWNRGEKQVRTRSDFEESDEIISDVQVWDDGSLVYSTKDSPDFPQVSAAGFETVDVGGRSFRVFLLVRNGKKVQVSQAMDIRRRVITGVLLKILLPFLSMILIFLWWIPHVIHRSFRPLETLRSNIRVRKASMLSPIPDGGVPEEILPLVRELNSLLSRLDGALKGQKQFLADAAHELRTPLTALDLQIQNARYALTEEEKDALMEKLKRGIKRASTMVNSLLTISRMESGFLKNEVSDVDMNMVAAKALADASPIAGQKGMVLRFDPKGKIHIRGNEGSLGVMMAYLLDNAIKYSPRETEIKVAVEATAAAVVLTVEDRGPGIPPDEREKVFRRFYRYNGHIAPGSGLGLSIVKEIADFHGAGILLDDVSGSGGLKVTVRFPRLPRESGPGDTGIDHEGE